MLCPKCGFISFDHLSLCVKCQNDLSSVGEALQGTAADVVGRFFLGALVKDSSALRDLPGGDDGVADTSISIPQEEYDGVGEGVSGSVEEDLVQQDGAELSLAEESPALELNLDELMPTPDSSDSMVLVDPAEALQEEGEQEEAEQLTLLDIDHLDSETEGKGEEAVISSPVAQEDLSGDAGEEIDPLLTLTLDTVEDAVVETEDAVADTGLPTTELTDGEDQSGQLTVDLDEIDLSDLVHHTTEAPVDQEGVGDGDTGGFELDDTMDLSLFVGEGRESEISGGEMPSNDDDLTAIDLTLVDDALVELSVDPGRKEQDGKAAVKSNIEGLSMEEGTDQG